MNIDPETLDKAEEFYLSTDEFEHWFSSDTTQPDVLHVEGIPMVLHNWAQPYSDPWFSPNSELRAMVERAGYARPKPESPPQPAVRKLTRSADAVWTLFRCNSQVIAVNDDGGAAARYIINVSAPEPYEPFDVEMLSSLMRPYSRGDWRMRIDATGVLNRDDHQQTLEQLAGPGTDNTIKGIRDEVKVWVSREQGRRMPRAIPQLLKRISEARKIHPPLTIEDIDAHFATMAEMLREE